MSAVAAQPRGNRFKRLWTPALIIERINEWARLYGEPPRRSDWDTWRQEVNARQAELLADEWRARQALLGMRAGHWPKVERVCAVFGSWNAAIMAAGLQPRQPGQRTRRRETPSPFLIDLSHAVSAVYDAEHEGDSERLRASLLKVASVARRLAKEITPSDALR